MIHGHKILVFCLCDQRSAGHNHKLISDWCRSLQKQQNDTADYLVVVLFRSASQKLFFIKRDHNTALNQLTESSLWIDMAGFDHHKQAMRSKKKRDRSMNGLGSVESKNWWWMAERVALPSCCLGCQRLHTTEKQTNIFCLRSGEQRNNGWSTDSCQPLSSMADQQNQRCSDVLIGRFRAS